MIDGLVDSYVLDMLRLHLSDNPVADVDGALSLVHCLHKVAAMGAKQAQATRAIAGCGPLLQEVRESVVATCGREACRVDSFHYLSHLHAPSW